MVYARIFALFALAGPLAAQYGGPAILSRGDAPTASSESQLNFTPSFQISGVYDSGLPGGAIASKGALGNESAEGLQLGGGLIGGHSWRHTALSLSYHGSMAEYDKATLYNSANQSLNLSVTHQITRHITIDFHENASKYSYGLATAALQQSVSEPSAPPLPVTNFYDNRTLALNTAVSVVYQRSARLSFSMGGSGFLTRRYSSGLYGDIGATATGDVQYRLSRRSTIGANYGFSTYSFTRVFSGSDIHSFSGVYSVEISKGTQFSAFGGVSRVETKLETVVAVDPAITALLGITEGLFVVHVVRNTPTGTARLSHTFHSGALYVTGGRAITPGNGLLLTSGSTQGSVGYSNTMLRLWTFNGALIINRSSSVGSAYNYGYEGGSLSTSRKLFQSLNMIATITANRYTSRQYVLSDHIIYTASVGLGWSPGNLPIRVW